MAQSTVTVKVRGVPLEVDISGERGYREVKEIRCCGHEILCFFDDNSLSQVRKEISKLEAA